MDDLTRGICRILGRVQGDLIPRSYPNMDPVLADTLATLDLPSFQAIRGVSWGPWPKLRPGQDPATVRDSHDRDCLAWGMRDTIAGVWAHAMRATADHLWDMPDPSQVARGLRAIVESAARHGAIVRHWRDSLLADIASGRRVVESLPQVFVYYTDGKPVHRVGDQTTSAPRDASVNTGRHEWRDRPGCPVGAPIHTPGVTVGTSTRQPWIPVRRPLCRVDAERTIAAWHVCCAFAGITSIHHADRLRPMGLGVVATTPVAG